MVILQISAGVSYRILGTESPMGRARSKSWVAVEFEKKQETRITCTYKKTFHLHETNRKRTLASEDYMPLLVTVVLHNGTHPHPKLGQQMRPAGAFMMSPIHSNQSTYSHRPPRELFLSERSGSAAKDLLLSGTIDLLEFTEELPV